MIFLANEPVQFSATVLAAFESLGILEGIAEAHLLRAQVLHKLGREKDAARHQLDLASAHALILGDDLLRKRCLAEMGFA